MTQVRHLAKAPITEAVVDFRVITPKCFQAEAFREVKEKLKSRFPEVEEQTGFQGQFGFRDGKPESSVRSVGLRGYFLKSEDGLNVAQFRVDGFTFNRLRPYTTWDLVSADALELWDLYLEVARPEKVTRLALRYINRLELPQDALQEASSYLASPQQLPKGIPQTLRSCLARVVLEDDRPGGLLANISQAFTKEAGNTILILDIDAYKEAEIDPKSREIPEILEQLRDLKNRIFFGSLTDRVLTGFE